jgi:hemin uptake protein HemP
MKVSSMTCPARLTAQLKDGATPSAASAPTPLVRFKSQDLFQRAREIEIEHEGRIYRMRLTNLNKLILTA